MRKGDKIKMCHITSHKAFSQKSLVWGGFSWKGVTNLVFIDGTMKVSNYQDDHLTKFAPEIS